MSKDILSQEEIDKLLEMWEKGEINSNTTSFSTVKEEKKKNKTYKKINFKKVNRLQNENLGAIKQIHEEFVKALSNFLSMYLRVNIQVETDFDNIDQITYEEYLNSIIKGFTWGMFDFVPLNQAKWFIQLDLNFCYFFIDRSLGGKTNYGEIIPNDKLSEIDKEAIKYMIIKMLNLYKDAWEQIKVLSGFECKNIELEDSIQNVNLGILYSDTLLLIPIKINILNIQQSEILEKQVYDTTFINIGIPFITIEPILDKLNLSNILSDSINDNNNPVIEQKIKNVKLPLSVYLDKIKMKFYDLNNLKEGDIITLNKNIDSTFDLYINNVKKSDCKIYKIKNKLVAQIVRKE